MKNLVLGAILILLCNPAFPGSGVAKLTCKSESGRTIFTAEIQDITGILQNAEFRVDGSSIIFEEAEETYSIFDHEHGVFTMYIKGNKNEKHPLHKYVKFWAIPSTFKIIKNTNRQQIFEFKAKIYGTEPRSGKLLLTPIIELSCRLEYEI